MFWIQLISSVEIMCKPFEEKYIHVYILLTYLHYICNIDIYDAGLYIVIYLIYSNKRPGRLLEYSLRLRGMSAFWSSF